MAPVGESESESELFCLESDCKHERNDTRNKRQIPMIQCSLCWRWFHNECVNMTKTTGTVLTWWPCLDCRTLMVQVKQLQSCINSLSSLVSDMKSCLSESAENISQLVNKCDILATDNAELKESVAVLVSELENRDRNKIDDNFVHDEDSDDDEADELGGLLIGDSVIRSIRSNDTDFQIKSISGAKVSDIKKTIKEINPKKEKYNDLYILCGTNDISSKKNTEKIVREFDCLIKCAKSRAKNLHLASIIPRLDDDSHDEKTVEVNRLLKELAASATVNFYDNDRNFRYQDGSVDESLISPIDKVHPSISGSKKLLDNLKLLERATTSSGTEASAHVQKYGRISVSAPETNPSSHSPPGLNGQPVTVSTSIKFRGPHNSLSNFYGAQLRMWGLTFPSSEHAFHYRRAIELGQHATAELIRQAPSPRRAQILGREIRSDDRWVGLEQSVMYELLKEKSKQCPTFRRDLIDTNGAHLVEDTADEYWGRGQTGSGLNVLGRLLMTLRDNLPHSNASSTPRPSGYRSSLYPPPSVSSHQLYCHNCGEKSHTARSCRYPSPIQCYNCSERGHKRKSCPTLDQH